jgi:hypothetical protein
LPEGAEVKYLPEVDMWGIYDNQGGTLSSGATKEEAKYAYTSAKSVKRTHNWLMPSSMKATPWVTALVATALMF